MSKIATILVTQDEYDDLIKRRDLLEAFYQAGVHNWSGFEVALEIYEILKNQNQEPQ